MFRYYTKQCCIIKAFKFIAFTNPFPKLKSTVYLKKGYHKILTFENTIQFCKHKMMMKWSQHENERIQL